MTVLIDDHLLRDWMARPDRALTRAIGNDSLATTNLFYARLCKSAARAAAGALTGDLAPEERRALVAALVRLPDGIEVVPMRQLAWRMGILAFDLAGLSTLASEVVAAAEFLGARILVSSRDDSPGIRQASRRLGIRYATVSR